MLHQGILTKLLSLNIYLYIPLLACVAISQNLRSLRRIVGDLEPSTPIRQIIRVFNFA